MILHNLPYEKVGKNEPVCIADEVPFEIPESWEWVRLNTICTKLVDGDHNPPKGVDTKTEYIMASSTNINNDTLIELEKVRYLSADIFAKENERTNVTEGDIFFTSVGSLGRSCIYTGGYNICFQRSVSVISTMIYNYYLKYCLDSGYIQQHIASEATGTAQKGFYLNQLSSLLIPVPPIEEQYRIVAKYESISPYITIYATTSEKVNSINNEFPRQLKKSILQEAVQGKLVPQDKNDEPASVLLERIRAEKRALIKAGKIKKDKNESVIFRRDNSHYEKLDGIERCIDDEIPFAIPDNWCWVHLSNIMNVVSARRVHQSDWKTSGVPFYRAREVGKLCEQGYVDNELYISEELFELFSQNGVPSANDIMVTAVGTLGKTYVVKETDRFYYKDASVICFENFGKINPFYMQLVMASPYMTTQIKEHSSGTTVGTITISTASNYYVPVPPLAEQHRIVTAYNSLIPHLEQL